MPRIHALALCAVMLVSTAARLSVAQKPDNAHGHLPYTSPHQGGCGDGETAARFTFGGAACVPACDESGKCAEHAVHDGDSVHPICTLAANGREGDTPTHCALHCHPSSRCPEGAFCRMPEEVCVHAPPARGRPMDESGDTVLTTMGMTRGPSKLERLWAHDQVPARTLASPIDNYSSTLL